MRFAVLRFWSLSFSQGALLRSPAAWLVAALLHATVLRASSDISSTGVELGISGTALVVGGLVSLWVLALGGAYYYYRKYRSVATAREAEAVRYCAIEESSLLTVWRTRSTQGASDSRKRRRGLVVLSSENSECYSNLHQEDRPVFSDKFNQAVRDRAAVACAFRIRAPGSDAYINVDARIAPILGEGGKGLEDVVVVGVDSSELRRCREALAESQQELVHLSRISSLGMLSSAMAHELNQPLGSILTNAQAAIRFMEQSPPDLEEVREILGDIVEEDQRAGRVIARLRRLFKREEFALNPLNLNDVVEEVFAVIRPEITRHCPDVELRLGKRLPQCLGDQVPLQQVLINLLNNSCEAMRSVPRRLRRIVVKTSYRPDFGELWFSITDWGRGLSEEAAKRLFTPLFSTKPGGLGVGLAICKSILEAHGGRIWAENNEGGGASFFVTLPVDETSLAVAGKARKERGAATKLTPSNTRHANR